MGTIVKCRNILILRRFNQSCQYIAVEDEFLSKLTELRQSRVIYAYYGHVMSRKKDINGAMWSRSLTSFDPILVLFEYMKLQNMRLIDLFRSIDTNADKVISREELRAVFLASIAAV